MDRFGRTLASALLAASVATCLVSPAHAGRPPPVVRPICGARPNAAADGTDARSVRRAPDGMFYVSAEIRGRRVWLLVDTGATVVTLSRADAKCLGIAIPARQFSQPIGTANGAARMAQVRIATMRIAGQTIGGIDVAVMREKLHVSLLGQNALRRMGPLHIAGDELILDRPEPVADANSAQAVKPAPAG